MSITKQLGLRILSSGVAVFTPSDFNITALFEYAGIDCLICVVSSGLVALQLQLLSQ